MVAEIVYLALLIGLGFIYVLNLHLRGSQTQTTGGILAIVMLALFVVAFFLFHWLFGILCIVLTFAFTNLIVPVASRCAYRILGYRTGLGEPDDHAAFNRVISGKTTSGWDYFQEEEKERKQLRNKLACLAALSHIAHVLDENDLSVDDYVDLYEHLGICGLSDLKWEIVSDPDELQLLIQLKRGGKSPFEISSAFRRYT